MHILKVFNTFLGIFIAYEGGKYARGQIEGLEPPKFFKYITMDYVHRGSFNNTDCLRELLNCWEVVKPDAICSYWPVHESVCGFMRYDCHERYGWTDRLDMPLFESLCQSGEERT